MKISISKTILFVGFFLCDDIDFFEFIGGRLEDFIPFIYLIIMKLIKRILRH